MTFATLTRDWKSSLQPILTVFLVIAPLLTAPESPIHNRTFAWGIGVLAAAGKIAIGAMQKDSGTTLAHVPGESGPQLVASHETPDQAGAVPVAEVK